MAHYSRQLTQTLGYDVSERPGTGAAAVWGPRLSPIPAPRCARALTVLELPNADDHLRDAALTIVVKAGSIGRALW